MGSRPYGGYYRNLGRETFLLPVIWEEGWPVASPGNGRVEQSYIVPNLPPARWKSVDTRDEFEAPVLKKCWQFLRTPREAFWSLNECPGYLRLYVKPVRMTDLACPAFIGRRQQHIDFIAKTVMKFQPEPGEEAGLVLIQSNEYQYRFGLIFSPEEHGSQIRLIKCEKGLETVLAEKKFAGFRICLKIMARGQDYNFLYGNNSEAETVLIENVNGRILSTDVAGGFVGTFIGVFASSNGEARSNHADFDWFEYEGQ